MAKKKRPPTALERAIWSRERGIMRMQRKINEIRQRAADEVSEIRARIIERRVLLDALKRGRLRK